MSNIAKVLVTKDGKFIAIVDKGNGEIRLLTETTVSGLIGIDPSNNGGIALESTLQSFEVTNSGMLQRLDSKDFATQTTLAGLQTDFNNEDFSQESTQLSLQADVHNVLESGILIKDSSGNLAKLILHSGIHYLATAAAITDGTDIVNVEDLSGVNRLSTETLIRDSSGRIAEVLPDSNDGINRLAITGKVSVTAPPPPTGATSIVIAADNPLLVGNHDTEYIITNGTTFHIQQIVAGAAGDPTEKGSKITIIFHNGSEHVIERIYVSGFTNFGSYPDTDRTRDGVLLTGNGTNKIIIRREKVSGTNREIDAVVRGYES